MCQLNGLHITGLRSWCRRACRHVEGCAVTAGNGGAFHSLALLVALDMAHLFANPNYLGLLGMIYSITYSN